MKNLVLICILLISISLKTYSQEINYKVHAMFMYHFTKYIEWPESKKSGDFVIGILGSSDIQKELEAIASTKKAGTQTILVKKISSVADATGCHILFVSASQSSFLDEVAQASSGKPVLIVTEKPGLCKKGSLLNFIVVDEKLKFEINKSAIEQNSLKISSELLKLGILI